MPARARACSLSIVGVMSMRSVSSSLVVAGATHVGVVADGHDRLGAGQGQAVEPVPQDRLDAAIRQRADGERPGRGRLRALVPIATAEAHDPETRAESLL